MSKRTISQDELDQFELDENGRLYWQGELVLTEVRLSLSRIANAAVILAASATFGLFLLSLLQAIGVIAPTSVTVLVASDFINAITRP
jgi:hypothetical protein